MRRLKQSRRSRPFRTSTLRRIVIWAIFCSAMVLGSSTVVWAALRLVDIKEIHLFDDFFRVQKVQIKGISGKRAGEVRAVIEKQPKASLLDLDTERIRELLMQLRWVREALLRKEWPDVLFVKITERAPLACVEDRTLAGSGKGRYRLVDEDGVELEALDQPMPGLPVIRLSSMSHIPDTGQAGSPDPGRAGLQAGIRVLKAFSASGVGSEALADVEIEIRDGRDIRLRYQGLPLRLGLGDPEEQIRHFLFLKPELLAKAPRISEVDLRFSGRLIVKPKAGFVGATRRVAQLKGGAPPHPSTERR